MLPETAAGLYLMMMKLKVQNADVPGLREKPAIEKQYEYQHKADQRERKEDYEKSKMPESGYMLRSEYEERSKSVDKNNVKVEPAQTPSESGMKYVPVHKYKFVKYNNAPGFTELQIPRRLNFDREVNGQGIISSDFSFMVYPSIHYYASADCTTTDLYVLPLDTSLSKEERAKRANVIRKEANPILSTDKDIDTPYIFRTLTPIDFTPDNKKLLIKEKIGYRYDGIWKTDIWVYDFDAKKATKIPEIRQAIVHYWEKNKGTDLDEKRWDIYPMGFDKDNADNIIVCGYAYTGGTPIYLGAWSVNIQGDSTLKALQGVSLPISLVGYKLEYDGVESRVFVEEEEKKKEKAEKAQKKEVKKQAKAEERKKDSEFRREHLKRDVEFLTKQKERSSEWRYADEKPVIYDNSNEEKFDYYENSPHRIHGRSQYDYYQDNFYNEY